MQSDDDKPRWTVLRDHNPVAGIVEMRQKVVKNEDVDDQGSRAWGSPPSNAIRLNV